MRGQIKEQLLPRVKDAFYPFGTVVGILLLWQMTVSVLSVPDYVLPSPTVTVREFIRLFGLLLSHGLVTTYETILGLILAVVFAVSIAVAMVWSTAVEKTVMPLLVFFHTTPKIAIAPLFIVWFGFGYTPKIIISFWLAYFPIAIATITGLRNIAPEMIDLAKSMSSTTLQIFIKIRIPNSLPSFFSGLKLGSIVALLGAIVGEYVGSDAGLGYLITMANFNNDVKLLFSVVIFLTILGRLIYYVVCLIERHAISWHVVVREEEQRIFVA